MKSILSVRSKGLRHKLFVLYGVTFVLPVLFLTLAALRILGAIETTQIDLYWMRVSLWVGLAPAFIMSIAGIFVMYPSIRAIEHITKDAESFIQQTNKDGLNLVSCGDEAERIATYTNQMITELKRKMPGMEDFAHQMDNANRRLLQFALKDGLTGLYNQSCIKERLSSELARARKFGHHLSVVMLDIDDFKDYNDTHGHLAGDEALKNIALLITKAVRSIDIPSRYGGEEFMLILPETDENEALGVAQRIRRVVEENVDLTVSAGVCGYSNSGRALTPEQLIGTADEHLYEAKRAGKNTVFPGKPWESPGHHTSFLIAL